MAGKRDQEVTMIVPQLTRKEARGLRDALVKEKQKVAPNAAATIQVGKKTNIPNLMQRCRAALKGGD